MYSSGFLIIKKKNSSQPLSRAHFERTPQRGLERRKPETTHGVFTGRFVEIRTDKHRQTNAQRDGPSFTESPSCQQRHQRSLILRHEPFISMKYVKFYLYITSCGIVSGEIVNARTRKIILVLQHVGRVID